jgi:HEAT repeat protein
LLFGMMVLNSIPLPAQERPGEPGQAKQAPSDNDKDKGLYKGKPTSFWINQLKAKEVDGRREAVKALAAIGPEAEAAVPALLEVLRDDDTAVRTGALEALGRIGPRAKAAVPALLQALKDKDAGFRTVAIDSLGRIGPEDKDVVSALVKVLLEDDVGTASYSAELALRQMGPKAAPGLPALKEAALHAKEARHRQAVVRVLGTIGPEAAPALAGAVTDTEATVREEVFRAFQTIGPKAGAAVPTLKEALANKDAGIRLMAVRVLGLVGPEAVPALTQALKDDEDDRIRLNAALSLEAYGPKANAAVPVLVASLKNRTVGPGASRALAAIGSDGVAALLEARTDKDPMTRNLVWQALAQIGPQAKAAVPDLILDTKDGDEGTRNVAMRVLRAIGPDAIPALLEAVKDRDNDYAFLALGSMGPEAKSAVPELVKLLSDPSSQVRQRSARVLGMIGRPAKEAAPALRKAHEEDRNANVRLAAGQALPLIEDR